MIRAAVVLAFGAVAIGCGGADAPVHVTMPAPTTVASAPVAAPAATASAAASTTAAAPPSLSAFDITATQSTKAADVARSLAQEVGPRLAGSAGDKLAVAWGLKTMTAAGLTNVHLEPVTAPVWKRGAESAEILTPVRQSLAIAALGWSGATPKEGVTGEVIEVDSLEAITKLPQGSAKGKVIFANVVMKKSIDGAGYGAAVPVRLAGPKAAMEAGALAFVIRTVGTAEDRFPHAGATLLREVAKPIVAGALATTDAELLHAMLTKYPDLKLKIVLTPERAHDAATSNVVGEIAGTNRKDDVVLMGAHLDSWDLGRGAIDDAAGCGIVLEAARLIGERARSEGHTGPSRTIRVVFFAAEENSGAGGKAYAALHAAEAAKHLLAMEADSGTDRALSIRFMGTANKTFDDIAGLVLPLGITRETGDAHPGSDVTPLVNAGVPTVDLRQDASRYFDLHHSADDTEDKLDARAMAQAATAFAEVAWHVSEMAGDLGRALPQKASP